MKQTLITIVITILIITLPLAIMPSEELYNLPKVIILIAGGATLLILLLVNYKKLKLDKKDYIILVFAILVFISTMLSKHVETSIMGEKNRYEGMLAFYTYILIYFCAKKFLQYKNNRTLLNILHIVYISISILGILQYYINLPTNALYPIFNRGACGTFGNTNFMGSFISMGIPVFIITYIIKNNKISLCTSLLVFFNLIACEARSGWVAFIVFSIIMLAYLIKNKKKEYLKRATILLLCFVMIFGVLYLPSNSNIRNKLNKTKEEFLIAKKSGTNDRLGSGRIQIWKISIELIEKYPIFGVGTDNLKRGIYENLTETSINFIQKAKALIDKAHNEYLHIAVTLGIPALIIYLIFIALIIVPNIKKFFKQESILIILSVIISYLVQAFFNISTIGIAPLFWLTLGVLDNETINNKQKLLKK